MAAQAGGRADPPVATRWDDRCSTLLRPGPSYYRVTWRGIRRSGVLSGMGSYSTRGEGRYHRPHQRTVYASDDVLVSITEMAWTQVGHAPRVRLPPHFTHSAPRR